MRLTSEQREVQRDKEIYDFEKKTYEITQLIVRDINPFHKWERNEIEKFTKYYLDNFLLNAYIATHFMFKFETFVELINVRTYEVKIRWWFYPFDKSYSEFIIIARRKTRAEALGRLHDSLIMNITLNDSFTPAKIEKLFDPLFKREEERANQDLHKGLA